MLILIITVNYYYEAKIVDPFSTKSNKMQAIKLKYKKMKGRKKYEEMQVL